MSSRNEARSYWLIVLLAAALLMVTMGSRQSQGLFLSPLNTSTGLGIATISLAMAVGQFVWGAVQPIAGAVADRYGPGRVLLAGGLISSLGLALTPSLFTGVGIVLTVGLLSAIRSRANSFAGLICPVAPPHPKS